MRYAFDVSKIQENLAEPLRDPLKGMSKTIGWFLNNEKWYMYVQDGSYQRQRLEWLLYE